MEPALVKRLAEYPSFIYAKEYAELDAPEFLVERARRLYVLSPLLDSDWNWTPFRFARDEAAEISFFQLDLRQGEAAVLAVSPGGYVIDGIDCSASLRLEPADIRDGFRTEEASWLLRVLKHRIGDQGARSFCIWRTHEDRAWHAPSRMTRTRQAAEDPLGMVWFLAAPPAAIGAFASHFADSPEVGRVVERFLSADSSRVDDVLNDELPEAVATMVKERAWVMGLER